MQAEIIQSVLDGKDTLALLPTGGGKSLCFQVPAMMKDGICIVVSPLIALIKDQVSNLNKRGIKAVALISGMSRRELDITLDNCAYGNYKFLYLSPERLTTELARERITKMKVNLLAVDEAHCISQWGYDFRPAYLKIAEAKPLLEGVPILALTATATEDVKKDICEKLEFKEENIFQNSFERKNIANIVRYEESKLNKLVAIFTKVQGTGIVYVRKRKKTKEIANHLLKNGISADYYHAGLDIGTRSLKQEKWIRDETRVMVCTNAFGMGIDKPDVRLVVHTDLPDNIESYYQESGRAGRDGRKSFAILLYNISDKLEVDHRLKNNYPTHREVVQVYNALGNYFQLATGAGEGQSFDFDIVDFAITFQLDIVKTHNSLKLIEQQGLIVVSDSVFIPSRIKVIVNKEELYKFQIANRKFDPFIKLLLRTHIGLFEDFVNVNERELAQRFDLSKKNIIAYLEYLNKLNLIAYEIQSDRPKITFMVARKSADNLGLDVSFIRNRKALYERKLRAILSYAVNKTQCRSRFVLDYFGEQDNHRCGACDICLERHKLGLSDLEYDAVIKEIHAQIKLGNNNLDELVRNVKKYNEQKIFQTLRGLMDSGQVVQYDNKQLVWSE